MCLTGLRLQRPANRAPDVADPTDQSFEVIATVGTQLPQLSLPVECLTALTCERSLNNN